MWSSVLSIAAIIPFVYALKALIAGSLSFEALAALLIGAASAWLFIRRQRRLTVPLIDLELFKIPAFSGAIAATGLSIFAFVGLLFFFSQYLQLVRGLSPLQAGLVELPSAVASAAVILVVTLCLRWLGMGRAIALGLLLAGIGLAMLAVTEAMPGLVGIIISIIVVGLGVGIALTLATDAVVSAAPPERAGAAASISETAYELGVALGIAVLGSVHTALYRLFLPDLGGLDGPVAASVHQSLAVATGDLAGTPEAAILEQARHAFTSGMQITATIAALLLVCSAVIAWRVIPSPRAPHAPRP